jgi:hypothetical protein
MCGKGSTFSRIVPILLSGDDPRNYPFGGMEKMQPKPIDFRRALDIDMQRRTVNMEGFAVYLRGLSDHKEDPAETDYDAVHDEQARRDGEETAKKSAFRLKHPPPDIADFPDTVDLPDEAAPAQNPLDEKVDERAEPLGNPSQESPSKDAPPSDQKGSRLDIEA